MLYMIIVEPTPMMWSGRTVFGSETKYLNSYM